MWVMTATTIDNNGIFKQQTLNCSFTQIEKFLHQIAYFKIPNLQESIFRSRHSEIVHTQHELKQVLIVNCLAVNQGNS